MIISASRRTDIPNYFSEWFFNRLKEGFLYVRNPMNPHQVSKIPLSPSLADCIVFWTKNPEPMLGRLCELDEYKYYFQFSLTGYGKDIEPNVPDKKKMLGIFQRLSEKTGSMRVIWRYDPIIFTKKYTPEYHLRAFGSIASALRGYTDKCVISFVDTYAKNRKSLEAMGAYEPDCDKLDAFCRGLADIAAENGLILASCAEKADLSKYGIEHNCCIDGRLIENITGYRIKLQKDKNQRAECGCMESIDIGAYNTCGNGCEYCYANTSREAAAGNLRNYDVNSLLLCGAVGPEDRITERKVSSLRDGQMSVLDLITGD